MDEVVSSTPAPEAPQPSAPAAPAAPSAPAAPAAPSSMLDAITQGLEKAPEPAAPQVQQPKPEVKDQPKAGEEEEPEPEEVPEPPGMGQVQAQAFAKIRNTAKHWQKKYQRIEPEYQELKGTIGTFRSTMQESGMTPDRLGAALEYTAAVQAGNFEAAHKMLTEQMRQLTLLSGKRLDDRSTEVLGGFPDLQEEVNGLRLSEERALELAAVRTRDEQGRFAKEQQDLRTRQQQAQQEHLTTVTKAIGAWTEEKARKDIDYRLKEDMILAKGEDGMSTLDWIKTNLPPDKWLAAIQREYDRAAVPKRTGPGGPAPLGGITPASAGETAPKDMFEAISRGLGFQS